MLGCVACRGGGDEEEEEEMRGKVKEIKLQRQQHGKMTLRF